MHIYYFILRSALRSFAIVKIISPSKVPTPFVVNFAETSFTDSLESTLSQKVKLKVYDEEQ